MVRPISSSPFSRQCFLKGSISKLITYIQYFEYYKECNTYIHTYIYMYTYNTNKHTHSNLKFCLHIHVYMYTYIDIHTYILYVHTYITYIHVCIHNIHTCMYTYIHDIHSIYTSPFWRFTVWSGREISNNFPSGKNKNKITYIHTYILSHTYIHTYNKYIRIIKVWTCVSIFHELADGHRRQLYRKKSWQIHTYIHYSVGNILVTKYNRTNHSWSSYWRICLRTRWRWCIGFQSLTVPTERAPTYIHTYIHTCRSKYYFLS